MNDRYLFRGKRVDNGKWVEGHYEESNGNSYINYEESIKVEGKSLKIIRSKEVIPETVGQCTGLKDKNGKLIFEGDICEYGDSVGIIGYCESDAMFTFTYDEDIQIDFSCIWGKDLEILGNIHDNPELLEVKE